MAVHARTAAPRAVGARVLRREDARFLRGRGRYVSDVTPARTLEVAFVRSSRAHALIDDLDVDAAAAAPGVVAVVVAADLDGAVRPLRARNGSPGYSECDTPVLAHTKVRMVGEPLALVVADSRYRAEDAAQLVAVRYHDLPPVVTIDEAIADGAVLVHDEVPGNLFNRFETTLPDEVRITSMRPRIVPKEGTVLTITVIARGVEDVNEFVLNLDKNGAFTNVLPVEDRANEGLIEAVLEMKYTPGPTGKRAP